MSVIRWVLVFAILLGTASASAQTTSLSRTDRASQISKVPAEVLVVLAKEEAGEIEPVLASSLT